MAWTQGQFVGKLDWADGSEMRTYRVSFIEMKVNGYVVDDDSLFSTIVLVNQCW